MSKPVELALLFNLFIGRSWSLDRGVVFDFDIRLQSLTRVDHLQTLHQIVLALEAVAQERAVT